MNAIEAKKYLNEHIDKLENLLVDIGLHHINKKGNEIRCAREEDSNPTSVRIKLNDNLGYRDFGNNSFGDIYKLVGEKMDFKDFHSSFKYICNFLNVKGEYKKVEKPIIFGGFFNELNKKDSNDLDYSMTTYPIEILNSYETIGNSLFQEDGINILTQRKYKIGYDWHTHRIVIPEFNCEGELVGVTSRCGDNSYKETGELKYYPLIEFPKSKILFGYCNNYNELLNSTIWLVESQKSVMRMDSMGKYNFLALGGNCISPIQIEYIKSLNPKRVIVALDEGLEEERSKLLCEQLKPSSTFQKYKVGYIYDNNNEYLKLGSKDSPADLSLEELKSLSRKVKWIYE